MHNLIIDRTPAAHHRRTHIRLKDQQQVRGLMLRVLLLQILGQRFGPGRH